MNEDEGNAAMRILLVDDEDITLETVGDFLEDCDHEVVRARNGAEALKRLEEQKDILSSEQLEMERMRIQKEKMALDSTNKQRVTEVTKELEEKLAARGFEIRKRMIGKKIVYQAVRR